MFNKPASVAYPKSVASGRLRPFSTSEYAEVLGTNTLTYLPAVTKKKVLLNLSQVLLLYNNTAINYCGNFNPPGTVFTTLQFL
jgi:hypothetical protein